MNLDAKYIDHYVQDGFVKVCEVDSNLVLEWRYKNINKDIMFDHHNSWIYFIVRGKEIVKIGETGQPLGIQMSDGQPKKGTECRLGRYRIGDGTDSYIRMELKEDLKQGNEVSIWAKKCQMYSTEQILGGNPMQVNTTIHKSLELEYLDYFKRQIGYYPVLNKSRK
jgi:hypothetical protein